MTPTKSVHRSIVSLKLPRPTGALVTCAHGIVTAMTGNPAFPTPMPTLASVMVAITDLQNAETAALSRVKGAVTARNDKRGVLVTLLQQLKGYIQQTADANPDNGAAIIESAGVFLKKTPVRAPRTFTAAAGAVSGMAKLAVPSAGHRVFYEWQYSVDGGKTWVTAPATLRARVVISGLTPATTVLFQYRSVTKAGEGNWSQSVSLQVK
jgi:hypothetical protein